MNELNHPGSDIVFVQTHCCVNELSVHVPRYSDLYVRRLSCINTSIDFVN